MSYANNFDPADHPRDPNGQFSETPRTPPEIVLGGTYAPGRGIAPDGFVFPPLRDGLDPSRIELNLYERETEPGPANPHDSTWHVAAYPLVRRDDGYDEVNTRDMYVSLSAGRPPKTLNGYEHISYDEVFDGDAWMTLEESPAHVRDIMLAHFRERTPAEDENARQFAESEQRMRERDAARGIYGLAYND